MRRWDFKSDLNVFLIRSILGWAAAVLSGACGLLVARLYNLSILSAAVLTLGLFGLTGGYAHGLAMRRAGGEVRRSQCTLLAVIWALCCIGGAFPLFFTMGTRPQTAIRILYSFAIFGAAGGMATTRAMKAIFGQHSRNDPLASILCWSFGFSLAAVVMDSAGEGLQWIFPSSLAWPMAAVMMTVVMGFSSGCSLHQFFKSERSGWQALAAAERRASSAAGNQTLHPLWILMVLGIPFYLNDLANIFIKDWRWWLLIDYTGVKLLPFLVIVHLISRRTLQWTDLFGSGRPSAISFLSVVLIAVLAALFIEQNGALLLKKFFRDVPIGGIPEISNPLWKWIDLSAGLLMVGIFEEAVFRGYLFTFLSQYTRRPLLIILFSSAAFGLIHWSGGIHQIITASAVGAVFMLIYLRTDSLPALIMSHFIVDCIDLAGVISPSFFRFF